jgi:IS5 family transposase
VAPKKSCLQSTIRSIKSEALKAVCKMLSIDWFEKGYLSLDMLRIDSRVVASNIAPPSDSQMLNDGVRVLSRYLAKNANMTGYKIRFTNQRKKSKSLAFQIFSAKSAREELLYPQLLSVVHIVLKQAERALQKVSVEGAVTSYTQWWVTDVEHYRALTLKVVDQTVRRVVNHEPVPSPEKLISLFEEHSDFIVKGFRDVQYGHKINLSTEKHGLITCLLIEEGNPADSERFLPVLDAHQECYKMLPHSVTCDVGYASKANVTNARALDIPCVVFHKRVGISFLAMGVKKKTFQQLRKFRAGIEGNISELKSTFGAGKATWKGHEGFKAYVWSAVLSYNLVRMARMQSG